MCSVSLLLYRTCLFAFFNRWSTIAGLVYGVFYSFSGSKVVDFNV